MGLADPLKTVILAMLRDMTQGKGGGDLQLSYVEHAFNANLCKHKSHSLNCC